MPASTRQLNVSITPHFLKFIRDKVKSGRYSNASELVREALRRLEQEEMVAEQSIIVDPTTSRTQCFRDLARLNSAISLSSKRRKIFSAFSVKSFVARSA